MACINFFCAAARAGDPGNYLSLSLCRDDETLYISCTFGSKNNSTRDRKIASVCAKGNYSPNTGYVQYRYGLSEQDIEMEFPKQRKPPLNVFRIYEPDSSIFASVDSVGRVLRFKSGSYIYSFEDHGLHGYRLIVKKEGRGEVFNKRCDGPGHAYISDRADQGLGVTKFGTDGIK